MAHIRFKSPLQALIEGSRRCETEEFLCLGGVEASTRLSIRLRSIPNDLPNGARQLLELQGKVFERQLRGRVFGSVKV